MAQPTKGDLDPFRVIVGVLANRGDSDLLVSVATAAGLRFKLPASDQNGDSHKNRIREVMPRILAAHDDLDEQAQLTAASIAVMNFGPSHWETKARAVEALATAGWELRAEGLAVNRPDVRQMFFPAGTQWDAHVALKGLFAEANHSLTIVDAYAGGTVFQMLAERPLTGLVIRVLCGAYARAVATEGRAFMAQHAGVTVEVREGKDFHDRFVIIDDQSCVHVGASIKDAGNTAFMTSRVDHPDISAAIRDAVEASWTRATRLP